MSSSKMIYGSFKTNILQLNENKKYNTKEVLVKPLSQRELYLYSDAGREMFYAQTLPSGASLLVKLD